MMFNNIGQIPIKQLKFLLATMPDIVILCINPDDEDDYIIRTINAIESISCCSVIALVLFPMVSENAWQVANQIKTIPRDIDKLKTHLQTITNKSIFVLGNIEDINSLCNTIVDYLI